VLGVFGFAVTSTLNTTTIKNKIKIKIAITEV
jgi:hypothetical protein